MYLASTEQSDTLACDTVYTVQNQPGLEAAEAGERIPRTVEPSLPTVLTSSEENVATRSYVLVDSGCQKSVCG
eukprot:11737449-Alexandrium_andersonii.AAC.1